MAAPASLFAHRDEPVERARHRATHEQQVALGIDPHHTEAELRKAPGPHVPGQGFGGALRLLDAKAGLDLRARDLHHRARARFDHRDGHVRALGVEHPRHAELATNQSGHYCTLISTSTPAGRSSLVKASIVCERESRMSISRLCVFSSNCSRLFLSMCGLRSTVHICRLVGSGIGPETCAPVFSAVRTMSAAAWSISAWSNALRRIRILPAIVAPSLTSGFS